MESVIFVSWDDWSCKTNKNPITNHERLFIHTLNWDIQCKICNKTSSMEDKIYVLPKSFKLMGGKNNKKSQ